MIHKLVTFQVIILVGILIGGCIDQVSTSADPILNDLELVEDSIQITSTPLPTRPQYNPGELVDYIVQTGDSLPGLAAHFNTSIEEILESNPIIPPEVTTLPEGLPLQIPIYFRSFWGTSYRIIPDPLFVNGPDAANFNTSAFVEQYEGWLKEHIEYAAGETRTGAGLIDYVASNFSVSPKVLLAILEYQAGALSQPTLTGEREIYPLGYRSRLHQGLFLQLVWAANTLNNGYYGWRTGELLEIDRADGTIERPDPWQNASTVAIQFLFNKMVPADQYRNAIGPEGFVVTFNDLFPDPWNEVEAHIPGSLKQPEFILPFFGERIWAFTGGPHTGWGTGAPLAAMDFAPSSDLTGCYSSNDWATAISDGVVTRSEVGLVVLDLDMDGDDRTGWVIYYVHLDSRDRAVVGTVLEMGEPVGHPSCEGGTSTGTHVHIARRFNGEWMVADSFLPFVMEGWSPTAGDAPYQGSLTRFEKTVDACVCANQDSNIQSTGYPDGISR